MNPISTVEAIDLGIDVVATFGAARALGGAAARKLMAGRGGRPPAVDTVRDWTDPRRGVCPRGPGTARLVLPALRIGGELRLMPEWIAAFEAARVRLGKVE